MPRLSLGTQFFPEPLEDFPSLQEGEITKNVLELLDADLQAQRVVPTFVDSPQWARTDGVEFRVAKLPVEPLRQIALALEVDGVNAARGRGRNEGGDRRND